MNERVRIIKTDRRMEARNTICTNKVIRDVAELVEEGHPIDAICDYLGINPAQFHTWKRKGDAYIRAGNSPPNYHQYGRFCRAIKKGLAAYRMARVRLLHNSKDWVREMAILERRDRRHFSRAEPAGGDETEIDTSERYV